MYRYAVLEIKKLQEKLANHHIENEDGQLKSLTSEALPSATQFFKRAYKISHFPGL